MQYYSEDITMPLKSCIFKEGDKPNFVYLIKKGEIQVIIFLILLI